MTPRLATCLIAGAIALSNAACGSSSLQRFPRGRPVVWVDDDMRPFRTTCRPDPEEEGHEICTPEAYVSPFAWDAVDNTVFLPLSRALAVKGSREAINVNSLDEVPDSSWFTNRIGRHPMTPEEVANGPCSDGKVLDPGAPAGSWLIDQGKPNGANPGFRVRVDGVGKFMLKADLLEQPERATAAAAIATRIYYAAGFWAPCDSVVYFSPSLLRLKPGLEFTDNSGVSRPFNDKTLQKVLVHAAQRGKLVRMSASRWLPGRAIGPFTYTGVRDDDPNDIIPHEHRRDLRGARLLAAWLNHFDAREQNSMNTWMSVDPKDPDSTPGYIRHWYIDLGDCFGSEWDWEGMSKRLGHAYYLDFGYLAEDFVTLGLIERPWDRARRTEWARIFGFFSARDFAPENWRAGYPNPAFSEMTERDGAWAARIIARFTPAHLRAAIAVGDLSNPRHVEFLYDALRKRQVAILKRYLGRLSPVSDLSIQNKTQLCGTDLAKTSGAFDASHFHYRTRVFAGAELREQSAFPTQIAAQGQVCIDLGRVAPANASEDSLERYVVVDVYNGSAKYPLRAHLYDLGDRGYELAGIERPEDEDRPEL